MICKLGRRVRRGLHCGSRGRLGNLLRRRQRCGDLQALLILAGYALQVLKDGVELKLAAAALFCWPAPRALSHALLALSGCVLFSGWLCWRRHPRIAACCACRRFCPYIRGDVRQHYTAASPTYWRVGCAMRAPFLWRLFRGASLKRHLACQRSRWYTAISYGRVTCCFCYAAFRLRRRDACGIPAALRGLPARAPLARARYR